MLATWPSATDSALVRTATSHSTYPNRIGMEFFSDHVGTVRRSQGTGLVCSGQRNQTATMIRQDRLAEQKYLRQRIANA